MDEDDQLESAKEIYRKVEKRISTITDQEKEDIAEQAISAAYDRIRDRRRRKATNPERYAFTSFFRFRKSGMIFTMQKPGSDFMLLRIKGGEHKVITERMSRSDMRELIFELHKARGDTVYKRKNRGWLIYVGKK